jgi:hypothetical protein
VGSSGDVYKIYSKNERRVYAAKFYRKRVDFMDSKDKESYYRELGLMQTVNHPFLIEFKE